MWRSGLAPFAGTPTAARLAAAPPDVGLQPDDGIATEVLPAGALTNVAA